MKIVALIFPAILITSLLIGAVLGVLLGFGIIEPRIFGDTRTIDHALLSHTVVDWVNIHRVENSLTDLTLEHNLNRLSQLRSVDMSSVSYDEAELISDLNVTDIATSNNLECIIDGKTVSISEYVLAFPYTKFRSIEEFVNFGMTFLSEQEHENEVIFASNITKTGIGVSANDDYLFVVQTFC